MLKVYKFLTVIGILLWFSLCIVTLMQEENPDKFDLKLGWPVQFLGILVYSLLLLFFVFCFKAHSQLQDNYFPNKIFYPIIIIGLINLIIPASFLFLWLKDIINPPKPGLFDPIFQNIFSKTDYTRQLAKTSNFLVAGIGVLTAVIIFISIRLKIQVSKNPH